jgi:glycosyltransferase involved in cell wall biosynthesis
VSDLPRLLLCCFDVVPAPTAASRRLTEYLKGLSDRYQVVVLTVKTPDHTHIERYHGARLLRVPVGSGDLAARAQAFDRAVRRQLDSEEYVLVHFFDPFGGYALAERRPEFGFKLIYDACVMPSVELPFTHDETEANRRFLARVRRQELFCLMNADMVIVASELTREYVCSLGVSREQVQVLPAPVDLGPYAPAVMGTPDATPMTLLHLGNLAVSQDLVTLLDALALAQQTVDVRLRVVGPPHPANRAKLEAQVLERRLTGKVDFQPPVGHDDIHKVLAAVDVGLLTLADVERNNRVGSPLSRLAEYLAAGRPVIAADVPAARALLPEDGVVLYRAADAASLADAITSLATDPARRVKLGQAARAAALERDAAKVRADLVALYVGLSGAGVRAVGDEETRPDEVTQLGVSAGKEDSQRKVVRARNRKEGDSSSGTNKVPTDPAIVSDETSPDAESGRDRPPVMGVPLREAEVPGPAPTAQELARELAEQVTTEPGAMRPSEPPVVMGLPVAVAAPLAVAPPEPTPAEDVPAVMGVEEPVPGEPPAVLGVEEPMPGEPPAVLGIEEPGAEELPAVAGTALEEPAPAVPLVSLDRGPAITAPESLPRPFASAPTVVPLLELPPMQASAAPRPPASVPQAPRTAAPPPAASAPRIAAAPQVDAPAPAKAPVADEPLGAKRSGLFDEEPRVPGLLEIEQITDDELVSEDGDVEEVSSDEVVELPDEPPADETGDEPPVVEAESVVTIDTDASPPPSALDPWLAQLVHGYCPPESDLFDRHTPPTTMPGRDT